MVAVRVSGIGKRYQIGALQQHTTLREHLTHLAGAPIRRARAFGSPRNERGSWIWALRDVSLDVQPGDVLGIVGRNGAGKSTLLKILSRITDPTEGEVAMHGRVGALLEVGTGFNTELTGRENVFLNGAILGMRRSEIVRKFDEIVDFSEVRDFIDTPVKRYSSGMTVRLAFAVAAHLEPEILIIDEVLAVGDSAFQKKCIGKMNEAARTGRTILFVSHNMGAVSELCNRAILLEKGRKVADGPVSDVIGEYTRLLGSSASEVSFDQDPALPLTITGCRVEHSDGTAASSFDLADEIVVSVRYSVRESLAGAQVALTFARNMVDIIHSYDTDQLPDVPVRQPGTYLARCVLPGSFLKAGLYTVRITTGTAQRLLQDIDGAISFEVEELTVNTQQKAYRTDRPGLVIAPVDWETTRADSLHVEANAATG